MVIKKKWNFNSIYVDRFVDHISKSVPFYYECHNLINEISNHFIYKNSVVYELGCSAGNLIANLAKSHDKLDAEFVGIDVSKEMIDYAKKKYKSKNLKYYLSDINKYDYKKTDLFISFYTIQFLKPSIRQTVINKIYKNLNKGGAFIFFEKTINKNSKFENIIQEVYFNFKIKNNFSVEEVVAKQKSLIGVLEPFERKDNYALLKNAGFKNFTNIYKMYDFEGYLAIK